METELIDGAPSVDAAVAWHHGDPLREQRAMVTTAAVVDRSHRDVLTVSGEDRLGWLHSICSQHLDALTDGDSTEALVLSPNGHVEQHWQLTELDATVWIDTEPGAAGEVLGYLQKMRFLKRVEPADVSADWAVVSVVGPSAAAVLAAAGQPVPAAPERAEARPAGGFVRALAWPGAGSFDLLVPRAQVASTIDALAAAGAERAGLWAFEALRVEARRPRLGFETDHRTIPHEVGWIGPAVHLDKGCYRGQETVARVANLGRPPRRLVLLHTDGGDEEPLRPGDPVLLGTRVVGRVGSAVLHHELGGVALALVKQSVPVDASELTAGASDDDGDRVTPVRIDPDSVPAQDGAEPPGRAARTRVTRLAGR